jgi:hypothetical protein
MTTSAKLLALSALLCASACSTTAVGPTPYQASSQGVYGFSEQRIETNRYRVLFEGNSRTTRQRVEDSLLLRASDVTLDNGYDWFQIVNRATDPKTVRVTSPGWNAGFGYGPGFASYSSWSPRQGWVRFYDPFWSMSYRDPFFANSETREITRFQASAEIILGKGAKPSNETDAFDARDVKANLGPRLVLPATQIK